MLHGVAKSLVVEETLNSSHSANSNIPVPKFSVGKVHDILLGNSINLSLNLVRGHAAASGNKLSANVLSNGCGAVEGQEDGGLELSLGTLGLGGADVGAEAHPLTDSEVDEVVNSVRLVGNKVDTPKTVAS